MTDTHHNEINHNKVKNKYDINKYSDNYMNFEIIRERKRARFTIDEKTQSAIRKAVELHPHDRFESLISLDNGEFANINTPIGNHNWEARFIEIEPHKSCNARFDEMQKTINELKSLIIEMKAEHKKEIEEMKAEHKKEISTLREDIVTLARYNITITAAECLKYLVGEQPLKDEEIPKYVPFIQKNRLHTNIFKKAKFQYNGQQIALRRFCVLADNILQKRNKQYSHYSDISSLEDAIKETTSLFKNNASLHNKYPEEYFVISNYEKLKQIYKPYMRTQQVLKNN